ncbi:hypothetical protein KUV57_11850 [Epibacterium sp. DP7N7-1]|nr:hypothetical protein [Epibacterium sp. DP7N7-1]
MDITIRRAANLQTSIQEILKGLDTSPSAEISIFSEVAEEVPLAAIAFDKALTRQEKLTSALFDIRRKTGKTNAEAGISELLTDQAELSMRIEQLSRIADAKPREPDYVNTRRANRMQSREEPAQHYGHSSGPVEKMQVNLLDETAIAAKQIELMDKKRQRTEIKDRLAELNAVTRITLSDDTVATLKAEHLL